MVTHLSQIYTTHDFTSYKTNYQDTLSTYKKNEWYVDTILELHMWLVYISVNKNTIPWVVKGQIQTNITFKY